MQVRRLLIVAAATLGVAGCGSSAGTAQSASAQGRFADLAHKCGESESRVQADLQTFVRTAGAHALHGSTTEAAQVLYTVVSYAAARGTKEPQDCRRLLALLAAVGKQPLKQRACYPYRARQVCFVRPTGT